ncbi:unnamed protein product [Bursaphelenchus xylophilus]|uniref:(pine wood nematode) hypothetical protein n=1 Tax=Bursaphelenchus xylophilus TaxID=6326 RepID=A0A1I7RN28_BURXY|nr:unnamed protein product [Bursaphelenchus xylophilus]CAG9087622.1 unnamed protein product [Bursaphelenchus xylophilus]
MVLPFIIAVLLCCSADLLCAGLPNRAPSRSDDCDYKLYYIQLFVNPVNANPGAGESKYADIYTGVVSYFFNVETDCRTIGLIKGTEMNITQILLLDDRREPLKSTSYSDGNHFYIYSGNGIAQGKYFMSAEFRSPVGRNDKERSPMKVKRRLDGTELLQAKYLNDVPLFPVLRSSKPYINFFFGFTAVHPAQTKVSTDEIKFYLTESAGHSLISKFLRSPLTVTEQIHFDVAPIGYDD